MDRKIAVVGLGYVGLPLAVAFGKRMPVIGFDTREKRVEELRNGQDRTNEVPKDDLAAARIAFTCDASSLKSADFIIVAVPTPIDRAKRPDLRMLEAASRTVGANLTRGSIVVFESTVYPGVTEDICAPILEAASGLRCGCDFFVGYSPERINPGDKVHRLERVVKVVSGQTPEVLDIVAAVYESIVEAGVFRAASIKTAEAAKVIENVQRDLNIALVNELSMIFDRIGIDTLDVLAAAGTKWNFLPFRPGLVGGHCIGVDPYYLTHKAEELGYHPRVILAGRHINDGMGQYVAEKTIKCLVRNGVNPCGARIGILGLTFKEDVPDLRNSRVTDIIAELKQYKTNLLVHDPCVDREEVQHEYGDLFNGGATNGEVSFVDELALQRLDAVILAVGHATYRKRGAAWIQSLLAPPGIVVDVKGLFAAADFPEEYLYWRL